VFDGYDDDSPTVVDAVYDAVVAAAGTVQPLELNGITLQNPRFPVVLFPSDLRLHILPQIRAVRDERAPWVQDPEPGSGAPYPGCDPLAAAVSSVASARHF